MGSFFSKSSQPTKVGVTRDPSHEIRIAVVGRTGSGISQFIHDATGAYSDGVSNAAGLHPFTKQIRLVSSIVPDISRTQNVVFIDTPGFDFSRQNTEQDMFRKLADWTQKRYGKDARLNGVIYMYDIWSEELFGRSALLTSDPLEDLCGPHWRKKVVFVSSHWSDQVQDNGDERERQLRNGYWSFMASRGSVMTRYEEPGSQRKAVEILKLVVREKSWTADQ